MFIMRLPKWVFTSKFPAFYDTESLTATEQTARVYGKMNELIDSWNNYVEEINTQITKHNESVDEDFNCFTNKILATTQNFITSIDTAVAAQNKEIREIYSKFSSDMLGVVENLLNEMKLSGELDDAISQAVTGLTNRVIHLESHFVSKEELEAALPYWEYNTETENLELKNITVKESL